MSQCRAHLTVFGRRLLVQRVVEHGWPVAHAAKAQGVSRQCAHRWINRWLAEGEAGLADRSSRPHLSPRRTSLEVEARIVKVRVEQRRGQDWLGPELGVPATDRVPGPAPPPAALPARVGPDHRRGDPPSKATAVRYERDRPGELVHVDVKKIGKIPDGGGWRALGREDTSAHRHKRVKIGYDYVHSMVDDCSRLAYSEIHDDETAPTCAAFLARAGAYFARCGITRIERVMTDNAFAYRYGTTFLAVIASLGARQKFIRPHCPWQNGKVERFNRTLQVEWAYHQPFTTNQERRDALAPWLEHYNTERRHTALGGQPPTSRLSPT